MAAVSLDAVTVRTEDGVTLLTEVSFHVDEGEHVVLVGPSGSGKTTVIRAVAGLEHVSSGAVRFDDLDYTGVDVAKRDVGIVFQSRSLFPTQTARGNVGFPLRIRAVGDDEIQKRVEAEARALGIADLLEHWPSELSAGHRQLVEIARAMVRVPNVLLLDEPMVHLDPPMRQRLRHDLKQLQRGYGVTTLHATNDPVEAMTMADRIVALDGGAVRQIGTPGELNRAPADVHIAWLTGPISFIGVEVEPDAGGYWLTAEGLRLRAWAPELSAHVGEPLRLGIRPDGVRLLDHGGTRAVVEGRSFDSGVRTSMLRIGDATVNTQEIPHSQGESVSVSIDRCLVFGADERLVTTIGGSGEVP